MNEKEIKIRLLMAECKRWIGTQEIGTNSGQIVSLFQNWDNSPDHLAWCMAFVQFCLKAVDNTYSFLSGTPGTLHNIVKSESCLFVWNNTKTPFHADFPTPGSIVIWQHGDSASGHTGIVVQVLNDKEMLVVEGNTGKDKADGSVNREGDGVYLKKRSIHPTGSMKVKGYLLPWG